MPIFIENRQLVTPGEIIAEGKFGIGSNVYRKEKQVVSQVIGLVNIYDNKISVVPLKGQYSPRVGDMVIGIVEEVSLNSWLVDISSPYPGVMKTSTAIKKRFDPVRDRARDFFDVGDVVAAKILSFDRTRDPMLTLWENNRYGAGFLGKLSGGRIIEVSPSKIPRIIGRRGSMINTIKQYTNCKIIVGQNGRVWIKGNAFEDEYLVIQAIEKVDREAHTKGLTDRVKDFLEDERKKIKKEGRTKKD